MNQLLARAASIGCRVYFLPLPPDHEGYFADNNVVVINSSMTEQYQREVLAHELGHVHYGHDWRMPHDKEKDEWQADLYAAQLLISPAEYALAESFCEHPGAVAKELHVSPYLVRTWQKWMKGQVA